jgi:hypothetical protein
LKNDNKTTTQLLTREDQSGRRKKGEVEKTKCGMKKETNLT